MNAKKLLPVLALAVLAAWYFFFRKDKSGNTIAKLPFDLTTRPHQQNSVVTLPHPGKGGADSQRTLWQLAQQAAATGQATVNGVSIDISKPLSAFGSWVGGLFAGSKPERPDDPLPSQDDPEDGYGAGTLYDAGTTYTANTGNLA